MTIPRAAVGGLALATAGYLLIGSFAVLVAGLAIAAFGAALLIPAHRPGTADKLQALVIRQLCAAPGQRCPGHVLTDPLTGCRLRTERYSGFLTLARRRP